MWKNCLALNKSSHVGVTSFTGNFFWIQWHQALPKWIVNLHRSYLDTRISACLLSRVLLYSVEVQVQTDLSRVRPTHKNPLRGEMQRCKEEWCKLLPGLIPHWHLTDSLSKVIYLLLWSGVSSVCVESHRWPRCCWAHEGWGSDFVILALFLWFNSMSGMCFVF